ncbi:MAG: DUF418 domain-containing protein [bacterium]|jgi:uncharacterized protein|nr:DUF418 domain-containing protein [bacterium]
MDTKPSLSVSNSERIRSIDVLRGFALLGILIINIQGFSMPWTAAESNPASYGDLSGLNYFTWLLTYLFANMKMMNLFSMLFGASLVLLATRLEEKGFNPLWIYYRRIFILLCIGLVHAYLLWDGDILVVYAFCGFVLIWFRRLSAQSLLFLGFAVFLAEIGFKIPQAFEVAQMAPSDYAHWAEENWYQTTYVQEAVNAYRKGFIDHLSFRVTETFSWHLHQLILGFYWLRPLGMMLMGMGLYKLDLFHATWSYRTYGLMIGWGFFIGLFLTGIGAGWIVASDWDAFIGNFIAKPLLYLGSLGISCGWIGVIMVLCKRAWFPLLRHALASVGQMALSNYLLQTIICTTLFYGHGFSLYGSVSRVQQVGFLLCIWLVQLVISPLWLLRFRFGPVEWLWRCGTYRRWMPLGRV